MRKLKEFTNKEKLEIFESAMCMVKDKTACGICFAVQYSIHQICRVSFYSVVEHEPMMDYLATKWGKDNDGSYWFPLDETGKAKRIEILDTEIKLLKSKL